MVVEGRKVVVEVWCVSDEKETMLLYGVPALCTILL